MRNHGWWFFLMPRTYTSAVWDSLIRTQRIDCPFLLLLFQINLLFWIIKFKGFHRKHQVCSVGLVPYYLFNLYIKTINALRTTRLSQSLGNYSHFSIAILSTKQIGKSRLVPSWDLTLIFLASLLVPFYLLMF